MTQQEALAKIAELKKIATEALEEAQRIADESNVHFVFEAPSGVAVEEDWEESNDWNDSGCEWDPSNQDC